MREPGITRRTGFTLIELLIVVAIIAILAAIAIPNFLEAQTRARVSRVKADMRSAVVALEAYRVDCTAYPILRGYFITAGKTQYNRGPFYAAYDLTSPVAYLTSTMLRDPFVQPLGYNTTTGDVPWLQEPQGEVGVTFMYVNIEAMRAPNPADVGWVLISLGPDMKRGPIPGVATPYIGTYATDPVGNSYYLRATYDPTNGTYSGGDILYWQGAGLVGK